VCEQAAVVLLDLQRRASLVDGVEQSPEVLPDWPGIVRIGMTIRLGDRLGRQEAAILAERDEQHPVEQIRAAHLSCRTTRPD
jgi:hypothetical protein